MNGDDSRERLTLAQKAVLILSILIALLAVANLGRLVMAIYYAKRLPDLPMTLSWTYLAVMGSVWFTVLGGCVGGLIYFQSWGRLATLVSVPVYQIHVWVNHLALDASERAGQLWPRDLACTALLLVIVWGVLWLPSVRRVFNPPVESVETNPS
jgi:hypothetical protein